MKKILLILSLIVVVLTANAQHHQRSQQSRRIIPMYVCNQNTYEEVIKLLDVIEKTSFIEKMEGIKLDNSLLSTYGGEILLRKEGNSIIITHTEFTKMLEDPRRAHDSNNIRTELYIQNVKLFEYISERLYGNRQIKNIYINTNVRTGAPYICVEYYRL